MSIRLKTDEKQRSDLEQLSLYKRIDENSYFENLILINKIEGADTAEKISEAERKTTTTNYLSIRKEGLPGKFDESHFKAFHKALFGDIYYFAGDYREMNMEIDSITRFCPARSINREASEFFSKLQQEDFKKEPFENVVKKTAKYLTDINALHPFREGNGRTKRLFFEQYLENAGYSVNWSSVGKKEWLMADECAFDSKRDYGVADTSYLEILLKKSITPVKLLEKELQPKIQATISATKKLAQMVEIEPLQVYKNQNDTILVKLEGDKQGEKKEIYLPKDKIKLGKDGRNVIFADAATAKAYNLKMPRINSFVKRL